MAKRKVDNSELFSLLNQVEENNNKDDQKVPAQVMSIDEESRDTEGNSSAKRPNLPSPDRRSDP